MGRVNPPQWEAGICGSWRRCGNGKPSDIADAVIYLACGEKFLTGAITRWGAGGGDALWGWRAGGNRFGYSSTGFDGHLRIGAL